MRLRTPPQTWHSLMSPAIRMKLFQTAKCELPLRRSRATCMAEMLRQANYKSLIWEQKGRQDAIESFEASSMRAITAAALARSGDHHGCDQSSVCTRDKCSMVS